MSNDPLTRFTHREAVALFHSAEALVEAADALEWAGLDRQGLSILGTGSDAEKAVLGSAGFRTLRDLLEAVPVPPGARVRPEDAARARSAPVANAIYVYAILADSAGSEIAQVVLDPIVAAAAAAAPAGGSARTFLLYRLLDRPHPHADETLEKGGLVLWALLGNDENEEPGIARVLKKSGGELLRVQDVPFERAIALDPASGPG